MRDDEVPGVDPSVFRKYFREDEAGEAGGSEAEEEEAQPGYNRAEVRDYKMPRRKTTKRKKQRKPPELERLVMLKIKLRGVILMFLNFSSSLLDIPRSGSGSVGGEAREVQAASRPRSEARPGPCGSQELLEAKIDTIARYGSMT